MGIDKELVLMAVVDFGLCQVSSISLLRGNDRKIVDALVPWLKLGYFASEKH